MTARSRKLLCAALLAALGAVIAASLSGCIPLPAGGGGLVNACVLCFHSQASLAPEPAAEAGPNTDEGAAAPFKMPALSVPALPTATEASPAPPGGGASTGDPPEGATPAPDPAPEDGETAPAPPGAADADPGLAQTLREAEGFCAKLCFDKNGVPHIGYGHQVTRVEAEAMLARDMADAAAAAQRVVGEPTWGALSERRREVLIEIAFWTGETGLSRFERMLAALRAGDFDTAADEITASALDPPTRAVRLANMMREG